MNLRYFGISLLLAIPALAQTAPTPAAAQKVAVIQFQDAVLTTEEGQQASAELKKKYDPRKTALEKEQAQLEALQERLQKGTTLAPEARAKMQSDLASGGRKLTRDTDDLNADVQEDEGKIMQAMAAKLGEVIQKYATANGFSVVLDVSSQQTPVLWAAQAANITADIVKQYDAAHPVKKAEAAAPKTQASR